MEYKSKEVTGFFELSIILEKFNILIYQKGENILSKLVVSNTRLKCFCEFSKIQLCFFRGGDEGEGERGEEKVVFLNDCETY